MVMILARTIQQGLCGGRRTQPAAGPAPRRDQPHAEQLWLVPGKVVQLDADEYRVRVLSGRIWVAHAGRDRILYPGEELWVGRNGLPTMLWTLMRQPALVEWRRL